MKKEIIEQINHYSKTAVPFIALISYDCPDEDIVCTVEDAAKHGISFKYEGEALPNEAPPPCYTLVPHYMDFDHYNEQFRQVKKSLDSGAVSLVNLCVKTPLSTDLSLEQIYQHSNAKLVVMLRDRFVCFTPELFVEMDAHTLTTYPMKGTISAAIADAQNVLLRNPKEHDEQVRMCQMMQQELSAVSNHIRIERFRYFTQVHTMQGTIWQTSSEISGRLLPEYQEQKNWGTLFDKLLPAGSISGSPKNETIHLLREVEKTPRGFYCGIFVHYDGEICRSYVLIRFVGKDKNNQLYYHSGGGITHQSNAHDEYEELKKKVYLTF